MTRDALQPMQPCERQRTRRQNRARDSVEGEGGERGETTLQINTKLMQAAACDAAAETKLRLLLQVTNEGCPTKRFNFGGQGVHISAYRLQRRRAAASKGFVVQEHQ